MRWAGRALVLSGGVASRLPPAEKADAFRAQANHLFEDKKFGEAIDLCASRPRSLPRRRASLRPLPPRASR